LCFFPFAPGEAHPSQYPFPTYENGDLFLAWGELGTRAYAAQDPALALKYVRNVLAQYNRDGLAFQRYLRKTQTGTGSDILANNCSTIVGLYRNLYGIQPKPDRLYLEPHLVPELNGTKLKYALRGQSYALDLSSEGSSVAVEDFAVRSTKPFALNAKDNRLEYFSSISGGWAMSLTRSTRIKVELRIADWADSPDAIRRWTEVCQQPGVTMHYIVSGLKPGAQYRLSQNGVRLSSLRADSAGRVAFRHPSGGAAPEQLDLVRE
jgi:hypothetical protein